MIPRFHRLVAYATIAATGAGCAPGLAPSPAHPAPVAPAPARPAASTTAAPQAGDTLPTLRTPAEVTVTRTDVARQALAVFGDSLPQSGGEPAATDARAAGAGDAAEAEDSSEAAPIWDIDVRSFEGHERVARYVQLFAGSARDRFARRLERGTRYDAMIRAKLRAGGIPEDMTYLALIESGYNPHAYSRAAAVGMWQFMTATARGFRLRVDWWVDERRDPVRSTDAAVRFLDVLRQQFGSLYLAAAAYNGGPGRVARGLTRFADDLEGTTGDSLFFALAAEDYLPKETKDYVPQLIAAAIVGKEPERYGIRITPQPAYVYDTVAVPGGTPLLAVAKASDTSAAAILDLNPHLLRGVTPPGGRFVVRVPVGTASGFARRFADLAPAERDAFERVTTRKETIAQLAARVGVSPRALSVFNPGGLRRRKRSQQLVAGQTVLVPSLAVIAGARDVPDPSVERYGSSRVAVKGGTPARTHVVRGGENLSTIAKRYGTTTSALMRMNGLKRALIVPGQELVVRAASRRAGARVASAARTGSRPVATGKSARTASSSTGRKGGAAKAGASASASQGKRAKGGAAKGASAKGATRSKARATAKGAARSSSPKKATAKTTKAAKRSTVKARATAARK